MENNKIPVMPYGKYKGKKVDTLPMSYLRWILAQKFPKDIMAVARAKVGANPSSKRMIDCTRHAIDSFSLRYLDRWKRYVNDGTMVMHSVGIASFLAELAYEAYEKGEDVSLSRHKDEELRKKFQDIIFVFNRGGEIRVLITVM